MNFLLKSAAAFLELVQTASGYFSVLLRWRARSCIVRALRTGQSLGSGCLTWEMVSTLLRFFCTRYWNFKNSTPESWSSDKHAWAIACRLVPRNVKSGKTNASGRPSTLVRGYFLSETCCDHS